MILLAAKEENKWSIPEGLQILAFKYRLTQWVKKSNFLRIKSDFIFPPSLRKISSA
jgi:hypothetical protein